MQRFPLAAKLYIWAVITAGVPAFVCAARLGTDWAAWPVLLVLAGVAAVMTFWKVPLVGKRGSGDISTMSLGFVATFFTLLCFGPLAGMLAGTVGCIVSSLYPRRNHYFQILFNVSAVALSALLAGLALRGASPHGWALKSDLFSEQTWASLASHLPAIFLSILVYYLVNTGLVATAIALSGSKNPLQVWLSSFLWTGPGYFAGASCAAILYGFDIRVGVIALPIVWVTYYSYKVHMDKLQAHEAHIQELEKSKDDLQKLYLSTVESLALAIDAKDRYTHEHILRVQRVAVAVAEEMDVSEDDLQGIKTGALLHDIGKLGIPEHILAKPGKLTDEEFEKIKEHPVIGSGILEPVEFPWPVMSAVRHHHERWDGKGYPDGLAGEAIPLSGRIMAVADVYDALTSDRSYREGWSHQKACDHIKANAGSHFDPLIVMAFLTVMERDPSLHNISSQKTKPVSVSVGSAREDVADGIKRASFEIYSLYEISQTVSSTLNLQETLSLLANKINKIFSSVSCVILLTEGDRLRAEMAVGLNEPFFQGARTRIGEGMSGSVARGGEGALGEYDMGDLLLASSPTVWTPLRSALVAPLLADNQVVGTVNLYHEQPNAFNSEDLRVLLAVSSQAGRAIQNARVFEKTRESALTDALTGLHNARYLQLFLDKELSRAIREDRLLSVLVMDLDNFKPINDTFGHVRGDQVLRDLGAIFQSVLRSGDLIARYAGDEFVAVLPGTTAQEAKVVAEKIRAAIAGYDPRISGDDLGGIRVGISVGASSFPEDASDAPTLIACADAAMYSDKSGRKAGRSERGHPVPEDPGDDDPKPKLRLVA